MRELKNQNLVSELQRKQDSDKVAQQVIKFKMQFELKIQNFKLKWSEIKSKAQKKLAFAILKVNIKKQKQQKHEDSMTEFCTAQLKYLKIKRLFRNLKLFCMWQKQWIAHVRLNAQEKILKAIYRQFYLNWRLQKISHHKTVSAQSGILQALQLNIRRITAQMKEVARLHCLKFKKKMFVELKRHKDVQQFHLQVTKIITKNHLMNLKFTTLKSLRLCEQLSRHYEKDALLNNVWQKDETSYNIFTKRLETEDCFFTVESKQTNRVQLEIEMGCHASVASDSNQDFEFSENDTDQKQRSTFFNESKSQIYTGSPEKLRPKNGPQREQLPPGVYMHRQKVTEFILKV